jgi:hypothetical protein
MTTALSGSPVPLTPPTSIWFDGLSRAIAHGQPPTAKVLECPLSVVVTSESANCAGKSIAVTAARERVTQHITL